MGEHDGLDALDAHLEIYARDGSRMSFRQWADVLGDDDYRVVEQTHVGEFFVSTVWLGLTHNFGGGPPLIFETMIFGPESWNDTYAERYSTEQQARLGHQAAVAFVQDIEDSFRQAEPSPSDSDTSR